MPRYFLHIRDSGEFIEDVDGLDLPDAQSALMSFQTTIREVLEEAEWQDKLTEDRDFELCDEQGRVLLTIPFKVARDDASGI